MTSNNPRRLRAAAAGAAVVLAAGAPAAPAADAQRSAASPLYQLVDVPPLLALCWVDPAMPRLETIAGLAPRHELRLSTPAAARLEPVRATYRYTFVESDAWALKFGVSGNAGEIDTAPRPGPGASERAGFGALPLLHFAGEGRLTENWRVSFAADGLLSARGRTVDLGLSINYLPGDRFSIYGGYRLSDPAGAATDAELPDVTGRANIGLRYRF